MFQPLRYLRRHVYPRGQSNLQTGNRYSRAPQTILGMVIVMLLIVGYAYILTLVSAHGLQGWHLQPEALHAGSPTQSESASSPLR